MCLGVLVRGEDQVGEQAKGEREGPSLGDWGRGAPQQTLRPDLWAGADEGGVPRHTEGLLPQNLGLDVCSPPATCEIPDPRELLSPAQGPCPRHTPDTTPAVRRATGMGSPDSDRCGSAWHGGFGF